MAKFKVGDKVTWHKRGETTQRRGMVIEDGPDRIGGVTLHDEYGREWTIDANLVTAANSLRSANAVVAKAIAAKNAMHDNGDVLVEFQTLGASGLERVSKKMSSTEFRDWLNKTGNGAKEQEVWHALMQGDKTSFLHGSTKVSVKAL